MKIYRPLWSDGAFQAAQQFQQLSRCSAPAAVILMMGRKARIRIVGDRRRYP